MQDVYSTCHKHSNIFVSYCSFCNLNLCKICETEHYNHKNKIILYKKEKLDDSKKKEIKIELKYNIIKIKEYINEINRINNIFSIFIKNENKKLNYYCKLYNKIIVILNNTSNYQEIKSLLNFKNQKNNINKDINIFLNENMNYKIKF